MRAEPTGELRRTRASRVRRGLPLLVLGLICIVAAVLVYTHPWKQSDIKWELTLVGSNGQEKTLSVGQVEAIPSYEGRGGFFTTAGVVNGPYDVRGVSIEDLCNLVGGIGPSDLVFVSASDGYSSVFDYDQVNGNLPTYDPVTLREVPHEELKLILIYEQDGKRLSNDDGKPLRLAVVGHDSLLTEGFYWVKWVNRIEVVSHG